MDLLALWKRTQEQGKEATRRSMSRVADLYDDAERRIRRKMRIHPRPAAEAPKNNQSNASGEDRRAAAKGNNS
jgi:hypothetical protein